MEVEAVQLAVCGDRGAHERLETWEHEHVLNTHWLAVRSCIPHWEGLLVPGGCPLVDGACVQLGLQSFLATIFGLRGVEEVHYLYRAGVGCPSDAQAEFCHCRRWQSDLRFLD